MISSTVKGGGLFVGCVRSVGGCLPGGRVVMALMWGGLLALAMGACAASGPAIVPVATLPPPPAEPYRLRIADVVEVAFFRTPELTQTRQVGPDGFISLNPVGQVMAAGLRIDELAARVRDLYASDFDDPTVTISVTQYAAMQVWVGGQVNAAGMLPYRDGLTLVQALMEAGGLTNDARADQVLVMRKGEGAQPVGALVNVDHILSGELASDVVLAVSDMVYVPRSRIASLNLFVQQFIRNNLPVPFVLGFDVVPR